MCVFEGETKLCVCVFGGVISMKNKIVICFFGVFKREGGKKGVEGSGILVTCGVVIG